MEINRDHSVVFEIACSTAFWTLLFIIMAIIVKMGTIKDRNVIDLEQKILRRGGKNTQKNYTKKIFMTQITTMV